MDEELERTIIASQWVLYYRRARMGEEDWLVTPKKLDVYLDRMSAKELEVVSACSEDPTSWKWISLGDKFAPSDRLASIRLTLMRELIMQRRVLTNEESARWLAGAARLAATRKKQIQEHGRKLVAIGRNMSSFFYGEVHQTFLQALATLRRVSLETATAEVELRSQQLFSRPQEPFSPDPQHAFLGEAVNLYARVFDDIDLTSPNYGWQLEPNHFAAFGYHVPDGTRQDISRLADVFEIGLGSKHKSSGLLRAKLKDVKHVIGCANRSLYPYNEIHAAASAALEDWKRMLYGLPMKKPSKKLISISGNRGVVVIGNMKNSTAVGSASLPTTDEVLKGIRELRAAMRRAAKEGNANAMEVRDALEEIESEVTRPADQRDAKKVKRNLEEVRSSISLLSDAATIWATWGPPLTAWISSL